jgi:exopolyphosphatase/guanosine-5'-triphosphate,3'-diphosphate pyrophosphatase
LARAELKQARSRPAPRREAPAARRRGPVAVIDIGSNSIRLVVFEGLSRAAQPMFNEKVMCGLGRGLETTGRLSEDGVHSALTNLSRFVRLARAMEVSRLTLLGTAAVRDAANGTEFTAEVRRRCGVPIQVVAGEEEARLSALGVLSGIPAADGLMGDLGGGSLELVGLEAGRIGAHVTLPIGPLRLMDIAAGDVERVRPLIDEALASIPWLAPLGERCFFPVGGAWRTLARIHMGQTHYPLRVIHEYAVPRGQAEDMCRLVGKFGKRTLLGISGISRRRLDTLPYAAMVLERLLRVARPRRVVFSAFGLREGWLFSQLSPAEQRKDPLIAACTEIGRANTRFGPMGEQLNRWLDPLFDAETPAQARLRLAACLLSDIGWRDHPDYRGYQAASTIVHLPVSGIDHSERALLALAIATRYGGLERESADLAPILAMLTEEEHEHAVALGSAIRLGYSVSGATPALLEATALSVGDRRITLLLPAGGAMMYGEAVQRRLEALGRAMNMAVQVAEMGLERKAS